MKLIESKAELLQQQKGIDGIYKQIELCGRTCYKSTDKITDDSARPFVTRMIASKHTAMLEQGTVYLKIPYNIFHRLSHIGLCSKYVNNPYSRVNEMYEVDEATRFFEGAGNCHIVPYLAVTTNYRVLVENGWTDDLEYACEPTKYHEKRYTIKFTCDRGVSHELVRHRVFSFAQESTRYCNYSKEKFGEEITCIKPAWLDIKDIRVKDGKSGIWILTDNVTIGEANKGKPLLHWLAKIEQMYFTLLKLGHTPQEARCILPNALKTEVCMTGFASDWRFFFDLRYYGETGKPHPDMELVASKARDEFIKAGLWDDIMSHPTTFNDGKSN